MALDVESHWKNLLNKGLKFTAIGVASAFIFAVANKLADNAVTNVVDEISALVRTPAFLIVFSEATDGKNMQLEKADGKPVSRIGIASLGERSVEVSVAPGNYLLKLRRDRNGVKEILNVPVILRNAGAELRVDVSHWAPEAGASHLEGTNPAGAPNLRNTRWTITQADWDVAKSASDPKLSQILRTALGQVGVYEKGSEADKAAILGYFKNTNFPASLQTPWGGAFLDWVMGQSGAPITRSPAFTSWQSWGSAIPVGEAQPGMIAIFDFPGLPEAPSKLVVGIFLRRTPACTEIIAGNIVNRVVITCVAGTPKMLRNPNLV